MRLMLGVTKPINLSRGTATDGAPSRSPDSRWVVFQSNRDGHDALYVAGGDGRIPPQPLTKPDSGDDQYPVWGLPNQIAYEHHDNGATTINIVDVKTGASQVISDPSVESVHPAWSPDGKTLAFETKTDGNWNITLYDVAKKTVTALTQNAGDNQAIAFAPRGGFIAFRSTRDGQPDIYVTSLDGKTVNRLTNDASVERNLAWSPDSTRIAYSSDASGVSQIYVVTVATAKSVPITKADYASSAPTWSCAGNLIIYSGADKGDTSHLFSIGATGNGTPRPLTSGTTSDTAPAIGAAGGNAARSDDAR
jgi:TolB protein